MSVIRNVIMREYEYLKLNGEQGSNARMAKRIAERLGYTVDQNGCNSFVLKVLREDIAQVG